MADAPDSSCRPHFKRPWAARSGLLWGRLCALCAGPRATGRGNGRKNRAKPSNPHSDCRTTARPSLHSKGALTQAASTLSPSFRSPTPSSHRQPVSPLSLTSPQQIPPIGHAAPLLHAHHLKFVSTALSHRDFLVLAPSSHATWRASRIPERRQSWRSGVACTFSCSWTSAFKMGRTDAQNSATLRLFDCLLISHHADVAPTWIAKQPHHHHHPTPRPTAFGLLKGNPSTTAFSAVTLVSDEDFSLRKTFHIINSLPPPAGLA